MHMTLDLSIEVNAIVYKVMYIQSKQLLRAEKGVKQEAPGKQQDSSRHTKYLSKTAQNKGQESSREIIKERNVQANSLRYPTSRTSIQTLELELVYMVVFLIHK